MATEELIATTVFCTYHQVDYAFVSLLEEYGLIEFEIVDQQKFIPPHQLPLMEKMIRLHQELDINISGIEAIINILERVEELQDQNRSLKNKLRFYERGF